VYIDNLENMYLKGTIDRTWAEITDPNVGKFWGDGNVNQTLPDPVEDLLALKKAAEAWYVAQGYIQLTWWGDTSDTTAQCLWVRPTALVNP
jgi:hypothetical protein